MAIFVLGLFILTHPVERESHKRLAINILKQKLKGQGQKVNIAVCVCLGAHKKYSLTNDGGRVLMTMKRVLLGLKIDQQNDKL